MSLDGKQYYFHKELFGIAKMLSSRTKSMFPIDCISLARTPASANVTKLVSSKPSQKAFEAYRDSGLKHTHAECKLFIMSPDGKIEVKNENWDWLVKMPDDAEGSKTLKKLYLAAAGGTMVRLGKQHFYKSKDCSTVYLVHFQLEKTQYVDDWFPASLVNQLEGRLKDLSGIEVFKLLSDRYSRAVRDGKDVEVKVVDGRVPSRSYSVNVIDNVIFYRKMINESYQVLANVTLGRKQATKAALAILERDFLVSVAHSILGFLDALKEKKDGGERLRGHLKFAFLLGERILVFRQHEGLDPSRRILDCSSRTTVTGWEGRPICKDLFRTSEFLLGIAREKKRREEMKQQKEKQKLAGNKSPYFSMVCGESLLFCKTEGANRFFFLFEIEDKAKSQMALRTPDLTHALCKAWGKWLYAYHSKEQVILPKREFVVEGDGSKNLARVKFEWDCKDPYVLRCKAVAMDVSGKRQGTGGL